MPYFAALAGSTRLAVSSSAGDAGDVVGAAGLAGGIITLVLTNRNAALGFTQLVQFTGASLAPSAAVTLLSSTGFSTNSSFVPSTFAVAVSADGWAAVPLPPFSVASVAVECVSC